LKGQWPVVSGGNAMEFDRPAALLLATLGVLSLGTGVYFLFLRPAMLPEDLRLTGMDLQLLRPEMAAWLRIVFRTLGGFVAAFGILMMSIAGYMISTRAAWLTWGVVVSILAAFGQFLASNIAIRSDFLWFVGLLFTLAAIASLRIALTSQRFTERSPQSR
jgi:hypothetical protein